MFQHKDFSGQLIWALQHYVSVNIQGPDESFFEEEMQEPSTVPGEGTNQHNEPLEDGEDGSDTIPPNAEELPPNTKELPPIIQDMLDWGGGGGGEELTEKIQSTQRGHKKSHNVGTRLLSGFLVSFASGVVEWNCWMKQQSNTQKQGALMAIQTGCLGALHRSQLKVMISTSK